MSHGPQPWGQALADVAGLELEHWQAALSAHGRRGPQRGSAGLRHTPNTRRAPSSTFPIASRYLPATAASASTAAASSMYFRLMAPVLTASGG